MTVRHVVMMRRRSDTDPLVAGDLVTTLQALGGDLPGVRSWRVSADEARRPLCWDHLLEADLTDDESLAAYLAHPRHQALLPLLVDAFELAVVDYVIQEDR